MPECCDNAAARAIERIRKSLANQSSEAASLRLSESIDCLDNNISYLEGEEIVLLLSVYFNRQEYTEGFSLVGRC